jgi:UDP-N-acetyl-D-glucosamine dehydrogenase
MPSSFDLAVVGLGYVGLPLVQEAVRAGLRVVGFDVDERKVEGLRSGRSHVDDLSDADITDLLESGLHLSTDPAVLGRSDTVVVCVPTPLDPEGGPDLGAVRGATSLIAQHLRAEMLVVLESTTYPGTTEEIVLPILEAGGLRAGQDFCLAYSPERIDPGNPQFGLRNTPKVVGGHTARCTDRAVAFYGKLIDTVVPVKGTREAEMAKLLENTYRHVNIALMNEMAIFCDELGVDLWDSIAAAKTKPFGFQAFYPGPGVGGHCIPIDPNYLSYKVRTLGYPFRFVELAQEINQRMPAYVVARAQKLLNGHRKAVNGARVLLLGVTYKPDISDERESPAQPVGRRLLELGADLSYHDPHIPTWEVNGSRLTCVGDLDAAVAAADLVVVLQAHSAYDLDALAEQASLVLDTRGSVEGDTVERL